jgi:proliferating cell nuclear antigen PCNA
MSSSSIASPSATNNVNKRPNPVGTVKPVKPAKVAKKNAIVGKPAIASVKPPPRKIQNTNLFDLYIGNTAHFKMLMSTLGELLVDVILDIRPDGFNLQSMDSAHIGMAHMFLNRNFFSPDHDYHCNRSVSISFNIPVFVKLLNVAHDTDVLRLYAKGENPEVLFIDFISSSRVSNWEMNLLNLSENKMVIPIQSYGWIIKMHTVEFQRLIRELNVINDADLYLTVEVERCIFQVAGSMAKGRITCENDKEAQFDEKEDLDSFDEFDPESALKNALSVKTQIIYDSQYALDEQGNSAETIKFTFSMRYMWIYSKTKKLSPIIKLSLRGDLPLTVEYNLDHVASNTKFEEDDKGYCSNEADDDIEERDRRHSWLRFYLAPKSELEEAAH